MKVYVLLLLLLPLAATSIEDQETGVVDERIEAGWCEADSKQDLNPHAEHCKT